MRHHQPVTPNLSPAIAASFRRVCDDLESGPGAVSSLLAVLVSALATAVDLPLVEPESSRPTEDPADLDVSARQVAALVRDLVGERNFYWEVSDPQAETPTTGGLLSDDVSDVYRDLRRGLHAWDDGHYGDAVWEWRFSFETHWGNHATAAIRVLHRIATG
jgi:hypothetical protein